MEFTPIAEIDCAPDAAVYAEGWQSWSPTRWLPAAGTGPQPDGPHRAAMRFRTDCPPPPVGFQAEGLLVIDPGAGQPVQRFAASTADAGVPTLRAHLERRRLHVEADAASLDLIGHAEAETRHHALAGFGAAFAAAAGVEAIRPAPTVWCSWYQYFEDVSPADIEENLAALRGEELPVEVVQIDDGWQRELGDWTPNPRFADLGGLAGTIIGSGKRAGIWLAPFIATRSSRLAAEHPDWLVGDAGYNWGSELAGLDLTRDDVREHLRSSLQRLVDLGFDYFKLDFLYGGALTRKSADPRGVSAYRSGLQVIRDAVGPRAYIVGCGAPLLPSVGVVDAMRVSSDTFHLDGQDGSAGLGGEDAVRARAWQHGRLWTNDADCLVLRPSFPLREQWAGIVDRVGGLRSFSDRIDDLDDWGRRTARNLLGNPPGPAAFPESEPR